MVKFDDLVARAEQLIDSKDRSLLGICGAPGAGKSTLAARLVEALGEDRAVLVGMDGFHFAQRELNRLGRAERKGAPDTFDVGGYVDLLERLRLHGDDTVYAPEFRREIEEPIACAVPVFPSVPLVVTEGNYLLLPDRPWDEVRLLVDDIWFLAPSEEVRIARLIARHEAFGRSPDQARGRALGSDQANAVRVNATSGRADLVIAEEELT
ncbi:nucleoside/nucleotide kinase family protein [Kutzneria sp. 744]|uniref:nucleoside/nucleotide kinase family protein n=1 Tax=Kutzneria sp. (strain 744) TaxID=345341 RepID=UPI0005BE7D4A|nr:nucleoside/nucleotide kinase family protein [Kutzneria sp. 744]